MEGAAVDWWRALCDVLGPAIEDRERQIASSPSVMAALGAMGHQIVSEVDPGRRSEVVAEQIRKLESVNWHRGEQWDGIAGKLTPRGKLTRGGSKETAYAIFDALDDESTANLYSIR